MYVLHSIYLFLISTVTFSSLAVGLIYHLRYIDPKEWRHVKLNATHQLASEDIHFQIKLVDCERNDLTENNIENSTVHTYLYFGTKKDRGFIDDNVGCYPLTVHFNGGRLTVGNRLRLLSTPLRGRFAHIQITRSHDGDGQLTVWFINSPTPEPLKFKKACPIGDNHSTVFMSMRRLVASIFDVRPGCEVAVEFKDHSYQQLEYWPPYVITTTPEDEDEDEIVSAEPEDDVAETKRNVPRAQKRVWKRKSSLYRVVLELMLVVSSFIVFASIGMCVFRYCWKAVTESSQSPLQLSSSAPKSSQ